MYTPSELAENYVTVAKNKTEGKWYKLLVLAVLAGAFIAFGGAAATAAAVGFSGGAAAAIKGAVFPVGLILVVICGAELFTGNCLLVAPVIERKVSPLGMLRNWGIVYAGNLVGGVLIAVLVVFSGIFPNPETATVPPSVLVSVAAAKCEMTFGVAFLRGILCNMLVCLAVWAAMSSKTAAGKILALYLPIFAFVACGFEHSVANMYYLTAGLIAQATGGGAAAALNLGNALLFCLLPSTLGNIVGGVAIAGAMKLSWTVKKAHSDADTTGD